MNKASRAIIMAAGIGKRMQPVTLKTPKPLVKVNGKRMIDSVICALHENGITEIYIVTGYLREQFLPLTTDYEDITLIDNPYYDTCNNISSLYVARNYIGNSVILDGDQLIFDSSILNPYFEDSCYCCTYTTAHTDEWLLQLDKSGYVTSCSTTGGYNGWQLFSVSFWNNADGERLKHQLEYEFEAQKNHDIYWDNIALLNHFEDYKLTVRSINRDAIIEIDSLKELSEIDANYKKYLR